MTAKLYEGPDGVADVQVGVQQQAMQVVDRAPARREPEERSAEILHALPELAADVDIASRGNVERNEFDRRPEIPWPGRALLIGRNVVIAQKVVGGRRLTQYLAGDVERKQKE